MGYTHYWTQLRDFTREEWSEIVSDMTALLAHVEATGIPLANGCGDQGSRPEITEEFISFNGLGDDSYEGAVFHRIRLPKESWQRVRGSDFCKTQHRPYDVSVTAALCYLSTCTRRDDPQTGEPVIDSEAFSVRSDGYASDFTDGLEIARAALPRKANQLDYPMDVMRSDRWCVPWVTNLANGYSFNFCVDGHAYIVRKKDGASYRFASHREAAEWAAPHEHTLNPSYWTEDRNSPVARAQTRLFRQMVEAADLLGRAHRPPAFVRPGDYLSPREWYDRSGGAYYVRDLLERQAA